MCTINGMTFRAPPCMLYVIPDFIITIRKKTFLYNS